MNSGGARWKCRAVGNEGNQPQVSLVSPPPLEIDNCDFHIPTAPMTTVYPHENEPTKPKERSPAPRQPDFSPSGSFLD
jgi:hypothetical protein